ncbi:hypothetical protein [Candidatus Palauibacter soopunensis]|uniref:hypothetical protein n=1 Tax=Candidatus Palauibacter soopunensis TaxID=3056739 RepID=UPI0023A58CFC|nr:hypothetical protein [Candidatus Palauibacter soopunensis]MDE2879042.1 hypothetical protein [Candidatus Palauibacter soopunensis]
MLFNRVVVGLLHDRPANENRAGQEFGPRQNSRLDDQIFSIRTSKNGGFDEREIEAEAAVCLNVSDNVLDSLADSVADDQKQEFAPFQPASDVIDEDMLPDVAVRGGNDFERRPFGSIPDFPLQVVVTPRREHAGVVEDLADDFPARVRVPPEFKLGKDDSPGGRQKQSIGRSGPRAEFHANRNWIAVRWIDLTERQDVGVAEQDFLQAALVEQTFASGRPNRNVLPSSFRGEVFVQLNEVSVHLAPFRVQF